MPVTITYDFTGVDTNDRTYVRSALERFHFQRIGGTVFRYRGTPDAEGEMYEDWLNHIAPAIMFMRSFILKRGMNLKTLTIDAISMSHVDRSDADALYGQQPMKGEQLTLGVPTNTQSSEEAIRDFIDASIAAAP